MIYKPFKILLAQFPAVETNNYFFSCVTVPPVSYQPICLVFATVYSWLLFDFPSLCPQAGGEVG